MKYKHIFFDFDGTLVDTMPGITKACNIILEKIGSSVRYNDEQSKTFVGHGSKELFLKAFNYKELDESNISLYEEFLDTYNRVQLDNMEMYPGVLKTLQNLNEMGCLFYIYSNKPHDILVKCVSKTLQNFNILLVQGNKTEELPKPNPTFMNKYMKEHGILKDSSIYVGDSMPDLEFAKNLGVDSMILDWGYGDYNAIIAAKPTYFSSNIEDLVKINSK